MQSEQDERLRLVRVVKVQFLPVAVEKQVEGFVLVFVDRRQRRHDEKVAFLILSLITGKTQERVLKKD